MPRLSGPVLVACLFVQAPAWAQVVPPSEPAVASLAAVPGAAIAEPVSPKRREGGRSLFSDLFRDTVRDARRMPSGEPLRWLGVGMIAAQMSHMADRRVSASMSTSGALHNAFEAGEVLGGAKLQFSGAFATYAIGRLTRQGSIADVGGELVRAQLITQGLTAAFKMTVRRGRPDGTQYSFPSGHTSTSFASATVLQRHFGWKAGVPAYAFATYVAASRVQVKRHFLSDVAFGAALGIAVGRTVTIGLGGTRFAVAPMTAPGGAGVELTLIRKR